MKTTLLALAGFHSHILGDILGARGPDGYQWPIPYFLPFSRTPELSWQGQWALNAGQNFVITGGRLGSHARSRLAPRLFASRHCFQDG